MYKRQGYYQETGRAGRDGEASEAWLAYVLGDAVLLRKMIAEGEASEERKRLENAKLDALIGYCESTGCRRQSLLAYFGEAHGGGCGHCDNCLHPPRAWDATEAARMALSCAYRTVSYTHLDVYKRQIHGIACRGCSTLSGLNCSLN